MNISRHHILRLFDANINRAAEGVRVLEETARMLFDDEALTKAVKDIRHELAHTVMSEKDLDRYLLTARGSEHDVLRDGETVSERTRVDVISIVQANAGRAQEALRTLEEYSKLLYPHMSENFKKIRFQIYDIEKLFLVRIRARQVVHSDRTGIFVIIDRDALYGQNLENYVSAVIDAGACTLLYSDKSSCDGEFLEHAAGCIELCASRNIPALVCDRLDCSLILDAHGIHLDRSGIPVKDCRRVAGPGLIIGYTETLDRENDSGIIYEEADYVLAECYFRDTRSRENSISAVKKFASFSSIPVIALCENNEEIIRLLFDCGIKGIALKPDSEKLKQTLDMIQWVKKSFD
jgi:thiamine-phosphate pyrophosphorylase